MTAIELLATGNKKINEGIEKILKGYIEVSEGCKKVNEVLKEKEK